MGNKLLMRPKVSVWARWPLTLLSKAVGSLSGLEHLRNLFAQSKNIFHIDLLMPLITQYSLQYIKLIYITDSDLNSRLFALK